MVFPVEKTKRPFTLTKHRIRTLPVVLLMPHSRCNCRCVMCDIWKANRNGHTLTSDNLEALLGDFCELNVRWVVLSGGEALMHPNLFALCGVLKRLRIRITLLSTGLLLKRYAAETVASCDEVIVSLDGSRTVHDAVRRVPRAFERLAEGVAALKACDANFRVTARCVVQRANYSDLPNLIDTARALGLDQLSLLAADVTTEAFNRPAPWEPKRVAEVALSRDEVKEFEAIVKSVICRYATDFASGFIAESPERLLRLPRYFAALHGDSDFPETHCNAPWVSAVVEADGTVRPCFFHRPLGNIHEQPLEAILNSEQSLAFRHALDVKRDALCRKCVCTLNLRPGLSL